MTFRSPRIRPALQRFVDRKNTYTIGVCNGNQQLVKLGLIEHGTITDHQSESDMTITHNT
ncbi:MAG: phosphoribosylformylglycinamidine synthase subunit PurQ, partial [Anaerolineae bacterium]|nr:phosphoribosylformylglycinamidine synthase subunit PurQ [Anaerolineae bacterium]